MPRKALDASLKRGETCPKQNGPRIADSNLREPIVTLPLVPCVSVVTSRQGPVRAIEDLECD